MKKLLIVVLFFTVFGNNTFSQNENFSGIYLTSSDFANNNLYLKNNSKDIEIETALILKPSYVKVITNEKVYYFHKDSIWGFQEEMKIYRFSGSKKLELISNEGFLLYKTFVSAKFIKDRIEFYFSENSASPVLPLSTDNLETAFKNNPKFHNLLHSIVVKNDELFGYDENCKTYKIVNIYKLSLEL